ncbi:hypothetical protein CIHG_01874 [Coccidioides immitis H538.4]|uniref:Uncharacterized protein n=3 Tax=Coccidioides immitis TaxID=5501 RepID=A0A0J8R856_COCIT|nr:hypothetical protein CIRG_06197 [Coccidioides immitis RMSCC 2394]KMU80590.1 hypothetical protein CISG_08500 [Coccidioides immitis RMSCC 3703]KMU84089.1 hypothetical protein CIHG_01874 [Coccidioides immitis H538.4]
MPKRAPHEPSCHEGRFVTSPKLGFSIALYQFMRLRGPPRQWVQTFPPLFPECQDKRVVFGAYKHHDRWRPKWASNCLPLLHNYYCLYCRACSTFTAKLWGKYCTKTLGISNTGSPGELLSSYLVVFCHMSLWYSFQGDSSEDLQERFTLKLRYLT